MDAVTGFDDVIVKQFTDDGRYLICFSRNQHDLVVFRFKGVGGFGETNAWCDDGADLGAEALNAPPDDASGSEGVPKRNPRPRRRRLRSPPSSRDAYFEFLYARPLTVDTDLLARDFAAPVLDGDFIVVASSTPPEAARQAAVADARDERPAPRGGADEDAPSPPGDGTAGDAPGDDALGDALGDDASPARGGAGFVPQTSAALDGAAAVRRAREAAEAEAAALTGRPRGGTAFTTLPGSPSMDVVAFHLVRLSDGKLCDRVVFREDYARLRRGAAVSAYRVSADEELLAVLSLRWQSFHPLRVLRTRHTGGGGGGDGSGGGANDVGSEESASASASASESSARFVPARTPVGAACAPDDAEPLFAADRAEREWRDAAERRWREEEEVGEEAVGGGGEFVVGQASDEATTPGLAPPRSMRSPSFNRPSGPRGWADQESPMYAGIKQKIMTRVLLEARRRDAREAERGRASVANARGGRKRAREEGEAFEEAGEGGPSTGVARPGPARALESRPRPGAFTSAFFGRFWQYAEWMVLWHAQLLDERRVLLRFGTAEDVLAWGTRRSRAEAGGAWPPAGERAPETVLVAVMDWVDGRVLHVGDHAGRGGGLLGVQAQSDEEEEYEEEEYEDYEDEEDGEGRVARGSRTPDGGSSRSRGGFSTRPAASGTRNPSGSGGGAAPAVVARPPGRT